MISLAKGIDFVGFRNFYYFRLLRKRNVVNIKDKINLFNEKKITCGKFLDIFQGWNAYADWANSYELKNELVRIIS